jgi:hypothetical protein
MEAGTPLVVCNDSCMQFRKERISINAEADQNGLAFPDNIRPVTEMKYARVIQSRMENPSEKNISPFYFGCRRAVMVNVRPSSSDGFQ